MRDNEMPLSEAAQELGLSWAAAWRLVLVGRLAGRKERGRWLVERASVVKIATLSEPNPGSRLRHEPKG